MVTNSRRTLFVGGVSTVALGIAAAFGTRQRPARPARASERATQTFEVTHTDSEWKARLKPHEYAVLRQEGTEQPYSSPLNDEHRAGVFSCAGCKLDLFSSATKFESHTGWPSFYKPMENAVGESTDRSLFIKRTEVHCRRCGGHLGHVFDDGPKPTGLRYCMNGLALGFAPGTA